MLIRHEGFACRVRADGAANSLEILKRLSNSFAFKTCEPLEQCGQSTYCTFSVAYGSHLTRRGLESLLLAIPGVKLLVDPISGEGDRFRATA